MKRLLVLTINLRYQNFVINIEVMLLFVCAQPCIWVIETFKSQPPDVMYLSVHLFVSKVTVLGRSEAVEDDSRESEVR